jgi:adenylylsulfate kinase
MVDQHVDKGDRVVIGCRMTPQGKSDPYSYEQRAEMIRRVYGDKVEIMPIPDIAAVVTGRNVGYGIEELQPPADIGTISGTAVRAGKEIRVPDGVADFLKIVHGTVWLTGLPCSGKSTLADALAERMAGMDKGYRVRRLDGDDVRKGLCEGLGFSDEGRRENLRRVAHVCKMFNDEGITVLASFVSPTEELREMIAKIIPNFHLVALECSVRQCAERDVKGMWAKAKAGEIKGFTGVDAPYEPPRVAASRVLSGSWKVEACVDTIVGDLKI